MHFVKFHPEVASCLLSRLQLTDPLPELAIGGVLEVGVSKGTLFKNSLLHNAKFVGIFQGLLFMGHAVFC